MSKSEDRNWLSRPILQLREETQGRGAVRARAEPSAYREIVCLAEELQPFPLTWHAYGTGPTSIEKSTEVEWTLFSKGGGLWPFERKYCCIWWIIMSMFVPSSM